MNMDEWKVTVDEFECKCGCGTNGVNIDFLRKLNEARFLTDTPFIINSGFRCHKHNEKIKGSRTSSHLKGLAADIYCEDSRNRYYILRALLDVGFNRIGIGKNFIHVDDDKTKDPSVIWLY